MKQVKAFLVIMLLLALYIYKRGTPYVGAEPVKNMSDSAFTEVTEAGPYSGQIRIQDNCRSLVLRTRGGEDAAGLTAELTFPDGHTENYRLSDTDNSDGGDYHSYDYQFKAASVTGGALGITIRSDGPAASFYNDQQGNLWTRCSYYVFGTLQKFVLFFLTVAVIMGIFVYISGRHEMKVEMLFLAASLILGAAYLAALTPFGIPDAANHFARAYTLSKGQIMIPADGYVDIPENLVPFSTSTVTPFSILRDFHLQLDPAKTVRHDLVNMALYNPFSYILQAAGVGIADLFSSNTYVLAFSGAVFNLIGCSLILYYAIRLLPYGKECLALIALTPMAVQERASLSVDALTFAAAVFFLSFFMRHYTAREKMTRKELALLYLSLLILASCKVIYFIIGFLVLLLPAVCFGGKRKALLHKSAATGMLLTVSLGWIAIASGYIGNTRGGGTAAVKVRYILTHPHRYIYILDKTFWEDGENYILQMFGSRLGATQMIVSSTLILFLIVLLAVMVTGTCSRMIRGQGAATEMEGYFDRKLSAALLLLHIAGCVLVATSLYVQWTAESAMTYSIEGIQGRYFLPFLPLLVLAVLPKRPDSVGPDLLRLPHRFTRLCYLILVSMDTACLIELLNWNTYLQQNNAHPYEADSLSRALPGGEFSSFSSARHSVPFPCAAL